MGHLKIQVHAAQPIIQPEINWNQSHLKNNFICFFNLMTHPIPISSACVLLQVYVQSSLPALFWTLLAWIWSGIRFWMIVSQLLVFDPKFLKFWVIPLFLAFSMFWSHLSASKSYPDPRVTMIHLCCINILTDCNRVRAATSLSNLRTFKVIFKHFTHDKNKRTYSVTVLSVIHKSYLPTL